MQRENNIKVKEVITTLCKLLTALSVESVPTAEVFRRAKFNKSDVTQDMWKLLSSLLKKAFEWDCANPPQLHLDGCMPTDPHLGFVRSVLWYMGYGSCWVTSPQFCGTDEIGSRDLLLAFSWVMAADNLLEALLREKVLELEALSSSPRGVPGVEDMALCLSGFGVDEAGRGDVRSLQWQYGKLRLQWRSLLAAQQEQTKIIHKVFSNIYSSTISEASTADFPKKTGSTGLDKDLERMQTLNKILETYLEWKAVEPLFWCWMDSVIDGYLSDSSSQESADRLVRNQAVTPSCSYSDKARRSMRRLDKMLLRLETELQHRRVEQTTHGRHSGATQLSKEQKEEVERRVAARLQGLSLANTPTSTSKGFIPYLQELQAPRSARKPEKGDPSQEMASGKLQALSALGELKKRQAVLQWELELLRGSYKEELQAQASILEGLVLIPPLKR